MFQTRSHISVFSLLLVTLCIDGSGSLQNEPNCGTQTATFLGGKSRRAAGADSMAPAGPPSPRIVGGSESREGEWPWQGVITYQSKVICGAGLLRNNWVVTLAQCIHDDDHEPSSYVVVMGTNNIVELSTNTQTRRVLEIYVHPNYIQDSFDHDIALLKTEPFTINDYVRPSCVPTKEMEPLFGDGFICTTAGFGATVEGAGMNPILKDVQVPIIDQEDCREFYSLYPEYPITDNMICMGIDEGTGVCTGDGPSVAQIGNQWYMVGLTSWYAGCAQAGYPGIYTRITAFEEWLTPIYEGRDPIRKNLECGRQTVDLDPEKIIVGGGPAQSGEWPWQAALYVNNYFYCGATLLDPEWIVTSAFCTPFLNDLSVYIIRMGIIDLFSTTPNEQRRGVSEVYIHPNFTMASNDWDIALVRVTQPFTITDYVRTACVPPEDMDSFYDEGRLCTLTGWGHTAEGGSEYPPLQEVVAPVYNQTVCRDTYAPDPVTDNMFCAGYPEGGMDSCTDDGGGPVVTKAGEQWFLTGIISWGNGCARPDFPGVNTKVSAFADWIDPIFNGGVPETRPKECRYDEFLCEDGWCIDYSRKCNGVYEEGCYDDTDEEFCGDDIKYFDPIFSTKLDESSIEENVTVDDLEHCAKLCLNTTGYTCMAFDLKNTTCYLAERDFRVVDSSEENTLHFEMEKFALPGTTINSHIGRIATPRWLPSTTPLSTSSDGLYIWVIKPDQTMANMVELYFDRIVHSDPATECHGPQTDNYLLVRDGEEFNAPLVAQHCLNELPDKLEIRSDVIRLEFYSVDAEQFGFLAHFIGNWFCDEYLDTSPGTVTSPLYPEDYPNNAACSTMITAPMGHSVVLTIEDFALEIDTASCSGDYDTLRVYDRIEGDLYELIGVYCGVDIPSEFRSSGRGLRLDFQSDSTVTDKGFKASFFFTSSEPEITTRPSHPQPTTVDPLRKELQQSEKRAHMYMVSTYVLIGLLPVMFGIVLIAFIYFSRRRQSSSDWTEDPPVYNNKTKSTNGAIKPEAYSTVTYQTGNTVNIGTNNNI